MTLTTEQERDLGRKLAKLQGIRLQMESWTREMLRLDMQWRAAHAHELELRGMIVAAYGESAAPPVGQPLAYRVGTNARDICLVCGRAGHCSASCPRWKKEPAR
jgi:hypothetical protein